MKYIRTKDGIKSSDIATHELVKTICDAGYGRTLEKGSLCRIGKTWNNFYGKWTSIIDIKGNTYDIRPDEVMKVTKELPQADTIEELCDEFVMISGGKHKLDSGCYSYSDKRIQIYGAIWTNKGLIYVAKMNEKEN